jgi:DNA-binding NarL/FixJ family response regulator
MKILIADDHTIFRKGVKMLLQEIYPFAEITEVSDAVDMLKAMMKDSFELVISDISMPPGDSGLDTLVKIKQQYPKTPVVILSMFPVEEYAVRAIKAGASAYLSKNSAGTELIVAVKKVLSGKRYLSPEVADAMAEAFESKETERSLSSLSNRELEVFRLLAEGKTSTYIAQQLQLSVNTINSFRGRIFEKMGFSTHLELIRYAVENKLV